MPTNEDVQFSTLERSLRDLWWASCDCKAVGGDPQPLHDAMVFICGEMERRHPRAWDKIGARLMARYALVRNGVGHDAHQAGSRLMRPDVLNRHHFNGQDGKPDHEKLPKPWIYIGRPTPLSNPYTVQEHGAERALSLYRTYLWDRIKTRHPETMEAFAKITWDTHLVCSCKPRPCHGDIVVTCWDWLQRQAWWSPEEYK